MLAMRIARRAARAGTRARSSLQRLNKAVSRIDPFAASPFSLFDAAFGGLEPLLRSHEAALQRSLARVGLPQFAVNVVETEAGYTVTAELPGVSKDAIKVDIDEEASALTISANKTVSKSGGGDGGSSGGEEGSAKAEDDEERAGKETWHRTERLYGSVTRSLVLPPDVDTAKITAALDAGVLTLTLPRKTVAAQQRKKSIEIQ